MQRADDHVRKALARPRCGGAAGHQRGGSSHHSDERHGHRRHRLAPAGQCHDRDRGRSHCRYAAHAAGPLLHGGSTGHDRRRPHRQVRGAGNHQCARPCRSAGARPAVAPIRALRRDHHHQHVFRSGRRAAIQVAPEGRRPARRAHPHRHVPLHVGAVQTRLRGQDPGRGAREGRRDRCQGHRFGESVDRRPGRPPSQAHPRVLRRGDGSSAQARQDHHGAYRGARRRPHDRR